MIIYPPQLGHPLVEEPEYLNQQQKCSLLADVGSQMAKDWQLAGTRDAETGKLIPGGEPGNKNNKETAFSWTPKSLCDIDNQPDQTAKTIYGAEFKNFTINYDLIWNSFSTLTGIGANRGPAAFTAIEKGHPHTAYLCFRGTLNAADVAIDLKAILVANPIDASGGLCHEGFSEYFAGCGINSKKGNTNGARPHGNVPGSGVTIYERLIELESTGVKHLVVTGHSLGSAVGTLATALANTIDKDGAPLFKTVRGSVSASPRVGNEAFKIWFGNLQDKEGNDLRHRFWRLRNESDKVPDLPSRDSGYIEVGYDVKFNADYPTKILAQNVIIASDGETQQKYEITKKGLTNWYNMGFPADLEPIVGAVFAPTVVGVEPPVFPKQEGEVIIPGWQGNPNHNPCCCYSYAINNPIFTKNPQLNAGNNDNGGSCHFPVEPPRETSGGDSPPS